LESIKSPFEDEATGLLIERKFSSREEISEKKEEENKGEEKQKFDDVDVSYDVGGTENKQMNINDDKVKDRWSRYIGAMGIEAVAKQAESRILLIGLGPLGIEIAKNLVLAGCKELLLLDSDVCDYLDMSGQFFMEESDVKSYRTKVDASKEKLQ